MTLDHIAVHKHLTSVIQRSESNSTHKTRKYTNNM